MAAISPYKMYQRLINVDLMSVMQDAIQEHDKEYLDLNKEQLMEGIDSKGVKLRKYKSQAYAKRKLALNPLGVTDLKLTGDFHNSFTLNAIYNKAVSNATDWKTEKLVNTMKYGENIFGLTPESLRIYRGIIQPMIVKLIAQKTGLQVR